MNYVKIALPRIILSAAFALGAGLPAFAADGIVGSWDLEIPAAGQSMTLNVNEADGALTGTVIGDQGELELEDVKFADGALSFVLNVEEMGMTFNYEGKLDGDSLNGNFSNADMGEFEVTGARSAAAAVIAGSWDLEIPAAGQSMTLNVNEADGAFTGTMVSDQGELELEDVKFADGTLSFVLDVEDMGLTFNYEGKLDGDSLNGNFSNADMGEFEVTGARAGAEAVIAGTWDMVVDAQGDTQEATLIIEDDGGALSGVAESQLGTIELADVEFADGTLTFTLEVADMGVSLDYEGTLDGDSLTGNFSSPDIGEFPANGTRAGGALVVAGTWVLEVESQLGTNERRLVINDDNTGTYGGGDFDDFAISNVALDGSTLTLDVTLDVQGQELPSKITLEIDGDSVEGKLDYGQGEATIEGTRDDS